MSHKNRLRPYAILSTFAFGLFTYACSGEAPPFESGAAPDPDPTASDATDATEAAAEQEAATEQRVAQAATTVPPFQPFVSDGQYYAKSADGSVFKLIAPSEYKPVDRNTLSPELKAMTLQERMKDSAFVKAYGFDQVAAVRPAKNYQVPANLLTPIRNQQNRGLCVAFAGTAAVESAYLRKYGTNVDISEQYVWQVMNTTELWHPSPGTYPANLDANDDGIVDPNAGGPFRVENNFSYFGNGNYPKYMTALTNYSVPTEDVAPYLNGTDLRGLMLSNNCFTSLDLSVDYLHDQWQSDRCDFASNYIPAPARELADRKVVKGVLLDRAASKDLAKIEGFIDANRPVAQAWVLNWQTNPTTSILEHHVQTKPGVHAMLIVGYNFQNPNDLDDEVNNFFIVKNSWGGSDYLRISYKFYLNNVLDGMVIEDVQAAGTPSTYARWLGRWNMSINGERAALVIRHAADKDGVAARVGHLLFDGEYARSIAVNGVFRDGGKKLSLRIPNVAGTTDPFARTPTDLTGIELEVALGRRVVNGVSQGDFANGGFVSIADSVNVNPVFMTRHPVPAGLTPMTRTTSATWVLPSTALRSVTAANWVGTWELNEEMGTKSVLTITQVTASGSTYSLTGTLTTGNTSTAITGSIRARTDKAGSFQYAMIQVPTAGWPGGVKFLRLKLFSNGSQAAPDMTNGDLECVSLGNYCPVWGTRKALGYAWLLANNPTSASYTPDVAFQFNSTGSTNTVKRSSVGTYVLTLPKLGTDGVAGAGRGGHLQVTSYDTSAYCKVSGWAGSSDVTVNVKCFDTAGAAKDARFVAFFNRNTFDGASTTSGSGAYLWSQATTYASATAASEGYSWNNAGKVNTISQTGTGRYTVAMPGIGNADASVQATAYGADSARCQVESWAVASGTLSANVACTTNAGVATNSRFMLSVGVGGLPASRAGLATEGAYVLADRPTATNYTPNLATQGSNMGGNVTVARSATGTYRVHLPRRGPVGSDTVVATAYGSTGAQCSVVPWTRLANETEVGVRCYSAAGAAVDSAFTLSYLTSNPLMP